jgi:hypothetical protein
MPNQADFDRVSRCIIEPIKRHWSAEFDSDMVADFVDDLARFDEKTLTQAMQLLRTEQKRRPSLAHIVEACKKYAPSRHGGIPNQSAKFPWHERDDERKAMIERYMEGFGHTSMMTEAFRDGWDLDLRRFVYAVAEVQAQMIQGCKSVGWDGASIFGYGTLTDEAKAQFFRDQTRQAQTGQIDVAIPTSRIEAWKQTAIWRKANSATEQHKMPRAAKNLNPGLDEYLERLRA